MLDPLITAEIQTVRLKLVAFTDRQSDQTVRSQCLAVDARLAEVLEGDDPILRQVLANSVEQLEEALRWAARSTIEKATFHFLTGLRHRGQGVVVHDNYFGAAICGVCSPIFEE
jgi:hypothetical protein